MVALGVVVVISMIVAWLEAKPLDRLFQWLEAKDVQQPNRYSNVLIVGTFSMALLAGMITLGIIGELHVPVYAVSAGVMVFPILIRTIRALRGGHPDLGWRRRR